MEESLKERQENELEVLQAIFMDDFCDLNDGNKVIWKHGEYIRASLHVLCILYGEWNSKVI